MTRRWIRTTAPIATALLVATSGCSDQPADKDTAVIVPDPATSTKPSTKPAPSAKVTPGKPAEAEKE